MEDPDDEDLPQEEPHNDTVTEPNDEHAETFTVEHSNPPNADPNDSHHQHHHHQHLTVDQARDRLETKLSSSSSNNNYNNDDSKDSLLFDSIQLVLKDHDTLKEKVGKLKSLLGRSAKAQRESKVEMDATQKRLDQALQEIQTLKRKVEKLSNRPSHMVRMQENERME